MKTLIYDTVINLANQAPEQHAETRQQLYNRLALPFEKQLALYSCVLGPASSGKLESPHSINYAVDRAIELLETPEH
ncbi:PAS factor family protein [Vibrio cincinnatiensis]|uniref:PAS factor family protein n=1 Tax=Vibrio cincinnatiensis TaxID=675 RepID=UPI001EDEF4D9|nr:PAS factor family protein [Vibrio cincinnatiensis]MCG3761047.1 secretion protein [Vibrio cincinnatiensis]MCG3764379.1 secretion protein [Vibrio cincinnatiensis]